MLLHVYVIQFMLRGEGIGLLSMHQWSHGTRMVCIQGEGSLHPGGGVCVQGVGVAASGGSAYRGRGSASSGGWADLPGRTGKADGAHPAGILSCN